MASSKETYCLCGQPYNIGQFMIECDCCREWFHGSCVNVKIYHSDDIDKYHCPKCSQTYGPSVLKIPTNNHRADRYELSAETRPSQVGTPAWVRALAARPLRPTPNAVMKLRAHQFTEEFIRDSGFTKPVLFPTAEGLEMKTPNPATFTVRSVLRFCGAQLEVEVIDVRKQSTLRMPLGEFVEYFETVPSGRGDRVLNVLSLEFSDTNMSPLVVPPGVARRLDWAESVWPDSERPPRPAVQKYCLMSAAGAYTDFHIDFGGTTVWYHVMHGRKIFYLIPPTSTNLALYQQWSASNNQNERFLGDMVEWYGTVELLPGQTLFIPSGWVHAVLTPCDSLVFGGNLLHSYAIETQLQVYEIERRVETPHMFRYPLFEALNWVAGARLLQLVRRRNEEMQDEDFTVSDSYSPSGPAPIPPLLLRGIKILATALKEWHALKSTDQAKRDNVPKCLNSGQLVRELCKELRTLEKQSQSAAKEKDYKLKTTPPKKSHSKANTQKKSLKLTLPKPIMHMGNNGEYVEDKIYADKFYIDNKEVYSDNRYIQDVKYINGLPEAKYIDEGKDMVLPDKYAYQSYEELQYEDGYEKDRKNVLKIKMNNPPSSSRSLPPPYDHSQHSILKSHLVRDRPTLKPLQQWTISKKDIGDYHEEQILFTNENLVTRVEGQDYGPGMYSAADVQPQYPYAEVCAPKAGPAFQPEYSYGDHHYRYEDAAHAHPQPATIHHQQAVEFGGAPLPAANGSYQGQLPTYDAATAHHYHHTDYVIEEPKPPVPPAVPSAPSAPSPPAPPRRSERAARRRVSSSYDYEDGDLFVDIAPPQRKRTKHRPYRHPASNSSPAPRRPPPANGIESLIQASVLADTPEPPDTPHTPDTNHTPHTPDTPHTQAHSMLVGDNHTEDDAVEGMLSIAERFTPRAAFGLPAAARAGDGHRPHGGGTATSSKRARKPISEDEEFSEEDVIKEVHRDEEYVYPSLELSSDEEEGSPSRRRTQRRRQDSRSRCDKDESWSPRARLGRLVPRVRGPQRAGRRESVRAALSAAAAAAAPTAPAPHAADHRGKGGALLIQNAKRAVLAAKSKRPPPPAPAPPNNSRLKKGMKTAKQRLGKILKIHKMIY